MDASRTPRRRWLMVLYVFLALQTGATSFMSRHDRFPDAVGLQRDIWLNLPEQGSGMRQPGWIGKTSSGRILLPAGMAALTQLGLSWPQSFSLVRLLTILAAYVVFHLYLAGWFDDALALAGTLFMAATLPLTFGNWFELPTDFPEIVTFTLGLWAIRDGRIAATCGVVFLGTFNRETTFLLVVAAAVCWFDRLYVRRWFFRSFVVGLAFALPYAALRLWTGVPLGGLYGMTAEHNRAGLAIFFTNWNPYNNYLFYLYLFGVMWLLPFVHVRTLPSFLRRLVLTIPAYLFVYVFAGGYLDEPRAIVALYPTLVPAGLAALFGVRQPPDVTPSAS